MLCSDHGVMLKKDITTGTKPPIFINLSVEF